MDNYNIEITPRWISKTDKCMQCNHVMNLYCIRLREKIVEAWYACDNEECNNKRKNRKPMLYGITYSGNYAAAYKLHLELVKKEKENKPEEFTEVAEPVSVKV